MKFLYVATLCLMIMQTSAMVIDKQCFVKEKSLAVLDLVKDSISKAKDLLPECDGGSNKTGCGKKEQASAYIEAALKLIEDVKKNYPDCNVELTTEPDRETEHTTELTSIPTTKLMTEPTIVTTTESGPLPIDCLGVIQKGHTASGVYTVQLEFREANNKRVDVYCDMETDGGGWTVIQRRDNYAVQEDFDRNWVDYKNGFGNISKDFWMGNDNIFYLTYLWQTEVRFDLQNQDLEFAHAQYSSFRIEADYNKYKLHISGYSGNAGDALHAHDQRPFSTKDRDNDGRNCAGSGRGGWWFKDCGNCNLNGRYRRTKECDPYYTYLFYSQWTRCQPLKFTEVKIRRFR